MHLRLRTFPILLLSTLGAFGQEALVRQGDRLFEQRCYVDAIASYERAFALGLRSVDGERRLIESLRMVRDLRASEPWCARVAAIPDATAQDLYRYADALRACGRYHEADSVMARFAGLSPADSRGRRQSDVASTVQAMTDAPYLKGRVQRSASSSDAMDLAPTFRGDRLAFASSRKPLVSVHRRHSWDGRPFLDLYLSNDTGAAPLPGAVNTPYHESDPTFSPDGHELYFTRSVPGSGRDAQLGDLTIQRSVLVDGRWSEPEPFAHNLAGHSTGHPSLSGDGSTLYFSSDRPGGIGGVDIWKCERADGGAWGTPVNLGPLVNTEGNEMFPSAFGDHALFFSSDGHAGAGGLDIFLSWTFQGIAQPPVNLGLPLNSSADDMGLAIAPDMRTVLFSSDRDPAAGPADLYRMDLDEPFRDAVKLTGRLISEKTGAPVPNIPVMLKLDDERAALQTLTDEQGRFAFIAEPKVMVLYAAIPGLIAEELPLDAHMLITADEEIALGDVRLNTLFDLPVAVRAIDMHTKLPIAGMHVTVRMETPKGAVLIDGMTDANGLVRDTIPAVMLGSELNLHTTLAMRGYPSLTTRFTHTVLNAREHQFDQQFDMGEALYSQLRDQHHKLFDYIGDPDAEGHVWAGRVIDANDKAPIAQVPVTLFDITNAPIAQTTTDAQGRYSLRTSEVPASLVASIPGGDRIELKDISPFGDEDLADIEMDAVMDLPVNALVHDSESEVPLADVRVTVRHRKDGAVLFSGVTDPLGICQGTIADHRFGTEQEFDVTFEKEGYTSMTVPVDISVLAFLEQALGGERGFALAPVEKGVDLTKVLHLRPIFFDFNSDRVRSDAAGELDLVARVMQEAPDIRMELRAHTDHRGSDAFNLDLSRRRARSVKRYLVDAGIAAHRLHATGVGERTPVIDCANAQPCTEGDLQTNRRMEFILLEADPRLVQGDR